MTPLAQYAIGDQLIRDFEPVTVLITLVLLGAAVYWKATLRRRRP